MNGNQSLPVEFCYEYGLDKSFTILRVRWEGGKLKISGSFGHSAYVSETLIDMRIDDSVNAGVSIFLEEGLNL